MNIRIISFSILTSTLLSACLPIGDTETRVLKQGAIADARNAPKDVHLAYLNCYAVPRLAKRHCQKKIPNLPSERKEANLWEYIRPYDYEAERLGFVAFLNDHGKSCASIDQGVLYSEEQQAFVVDCNDSQRYFMSFDDKQNNWTLHE